MNTKFKPGQSGNPSGRKPGTPNKTTEELREMIKSIIETHFDLDAIEADLKKLDSDKRLNLMLKLLEFTIPKLRSTEVTSDLEKLTDEQLDKIISQIKAINYEQIRKN